MQTILAPLFHGVNSGPRCALNTSAYSAAMEDARKSKIEPVHVAEAELLKRIFEERNSLSQEAFGAEFEIGTQGMVWQYLNHRSPLNLEAALKFARALHCSIEDFSPRLAGILASSGYHLSSHAFKFRSGQQDVAETVQLMLQMDERGRKSVLDLARSQAAHCQVPFQANGVQ